MVRQGDSDKRVGSSIDIAKLFKISVGVMFRAGPSEMAFDDHFLFMVDVRIIQTILEVVSESVARLNLGVQPDHSLSLKNSYSDAVVASRD